MHCPRRAPTSRHVILQEFHSTIVYEGQDLDVRHASQGLSPSPTHEWTARLEVHELTCVLVKPFSVFLLRLPLQ